jgi:hypothetical protein
MQATYKFPLVLAAGLMLGAGAIQALHAQAKPPRYLLAEVAVTVDEATYKDSDRDRGRQPVKDKLATNSRAS